MMGYSMSKTVTAAAVLRLVQEQKVGLDEPVQRYVGTLRKELLPHAPVRLKPFLIEQRARPEQRMPESLVRDVGLRFNYRAREFGQRPHPVAPRLRIGLNLRLLLRLWGLLCLLRERSRTLPRLRLWGLLRSYGGRRSCVRCPRLPKR